MEIKLNEDLNRLDADELVAFVRLCFNADAFGFVYGNTKELASITRLSMQKTKKALDSLFDKHHISVGNGKLYIEDHEKHITGVNNAAAGKKMEPTASVPLAVSSDDSAVKRVCDYYNRAIEGMGMPQIHVLTKKRKGFVNARLKEYGEETVRRVIDKAASSAFLNGQVKDFVADFEWIMRPNNFVKVMEGKYENRKTGSHSNEQRYYQEGCELIHQLYSQRKSTDID